MKKIIQSPQEDIILERDSRSVRLMDSILDLQFNKADKVQNAVVGNLAGLDSNGNLTDSGYAPSNFALNTHVTSKIVVSDIENIPTADLERLQGVDIVIELIDESEDEYIYRRYNEYTVTYRQDDSQEYDDETYVSKTLHLTCIKNDRHITVEYYYDEFDGWSLFGTTERLWYMGFEFFGNGGTVDIYENAVTYCTQVLTGNVTFNLKNYSTGSNRIVGAKNYRFSFNTGNVPPNITWPYQIEYWKGGSAPVLKPNTHYEISIIGSSFSNYHRGAFAECMSTADETVDISGKADKVIGATSGHLAGLDGNGNLTDSGYSASDFVSASSLPSYTIARLGTPETGYFASYVLQKDGVQEGTTINIPKDYLVKSGSVIDVVEYNGQYYDATDTTHTTPLPVSAAGKYLDFVVNTVDSSGTSSHIYIAVNDLVDTYTEGNGIDISNLNVVSVQIDSSNSNGLSVSSNGLALSTAVASSGGAGGSNGAMTATDKEKLNGLRKMIVLEYGVSTWSNFQNAFNDNAVVYCKASSNSNPATGAKNRYAFMAYIGSSNVEFQYYRSVSSHSDTQQGDQVFVYKLTNANAWSVETREAYTKIVAGTNLTSSYSNGALTINAGVISDKADKVQNATNGNFAGLDSNGNLTDSGKGVDTSIASGSTSANLPTSEAVENRITQAIQAAQVGAAMFKGTVNAGTDISGLTDYSKGWYWVVATAGTYVGQTCEVGDFIFCISDYNSAYSANDFSVVQNNIDMSIINAKADKVTGATSGNFAGLDSNGNLTDSGYTYSDFLSSSTTLTTITFRQW